VFPPGYQMHGVRARRCGLRARRASTKSSPPTSTANWKNVGLVPGDLDGFGQWPFAASFCEGKPQFFFVGSKKLSAELGGAQEVEDDVAVDLSDITVEAADLAFCRLTRDPGYSDGPRGR
jgi:hypothetical protein